MAVDVGIRTKLRRRARRVWKAALRHKDRRAALDGLYCFGASTMAIGWDASADLTISHRAQGQPPVTASVYRFHRPDLVSALGADNLAGFVAVSASIPGSDASSVIRTDLFGGSDRPFRDFRAPDPPHHDHVLDTAGRLLAATALSQETVVRSIVLPSLQYRIRQQRNQPRHSEITYEAPNYPTRCRLNVVVPFYRSTECVRNIMAALTTLTEEQLGGPLAVTFVCDDPTIHAAFVTFVASQNASVNRLPLRVIAHGHNRGFAAACNSGANALPSEVTIFLNSDVIASGPDTLLRLTHAVLSDERIVAASPTLLFADSTVQARQLEYYEDPRFPGFTLLQPPHRGLLPKDDWPDSEDAELLPGALLATRTAAFLSCGGFSEAFGSGDFEDAELCHRLRRLGRLVVISDRAIHLEAQSFTRNVLEVLARSLILQETIAQ